MRFIELLVIVLLFAALLARLHQRTNRPMVRVALALSLPIAILLHLRLESGRWQMIPAYVLAVLVSASSLPALRIRRWAQGGSGSRRIFRVAGLAFGFVMALAAAAVPVVFPVFEIPEPSGSYRVGVTWDAFSTQARGGVQGMSGRVISLQFWYPADPPRDAAAMAYMSREASRALAYAWHLPWFVLDHLALVQTHSRTHAPPAAVASKWPVVLVAWSGLMTGCCALAEELASRGYVVAAVGNGDPSWSPFVFDKCGRVLALAQGKRYAAGLRRELESAGVGQIKDTLLQTQSPRERLTLMQELNRRRPLDVADVKRCAAEMSLVIDRLHELNRLGFLSARLDLERVAVVGFSSGGAVAGQVCLKDARVKAGVNLDGFMTGDVIQAPLSRPFLFLHSETPILPAYIDDRLFEGAAASAYLVKIRGARHTNFGDLPLWGFFVSSRLGSIQGARCVRVVNTCVRAFLDKHLKGIDAPLFASPAADYPELEIRSGRRSG